jgi:hypothetical protein
MIFKISNTPSSICHIFADSCWEMLLKTIGQPLDTAQGYRKAAVKFPRATVLDSLLEILKRYRKATGKCPKRYVSNTKEGRKAQ